MLQAKSYSKAMDMWSVGCILAEMLNNRPLFPGKNYVEQLNLIIQIIGKPAPETTQWITAEKSRSYLLSLPHSPKVDFQQKYADAVPDAIDLLNLMLALNPVRALSLAWMGLHCDRLVTHFCSGLDICRRSFPC
jgi:serine/threonine protein kinase